MADLLKGLEVKVAPSVQGAIGVPLTSETQVTITTNDEQYATDVSTTNYQEDITRAQNPFPFEFQGFAGVYVFGESGLDVTNEEFYKTFSDLDKAIKDKPEAEKKLTDLKTALATAKTELTAKTTERDKKEVELTQKMADLKILEAAQPIDQKAVNALNAEIGLLQIDLKDLIQAVLDKQSEVTAKQAEVDAMKNVVVGNQKPLERNKINFGAEMGLGYYHLAKRRLLSDTYAATAAHPSLNVNYEDYTFEQSQDVFGPSAALRFEFTKQKVESDEKSNTVSITEDRKVNFALRYTLDILPSSLSPLLSEGAEVGHAFKATEFELPMRSNIWAAELGYGPIFGALVYQHGFKNENGSGVIFGEADGATAPIYVETNNSVSVAVGLKL